MLCFYIYTYCIKTHLPLFLLFFCGGEHLKSTVSSVFKTVINYHKTIILCRRSLKRLLPIGFNLSSVSGFFSLRLVFFTTYGYSSKYQSSFCRDYSIPLCMHTIKFHHLLLSCQKYPAILLGI